MDVTLRSEVRALPVGLRGWLIEVPSQEAVHSLARHLVRAGLPGVTDVVPGARTVLVDGDVDAAGLRRAVDDWPGPGGEAATADVVHIPVTYDGADLDDVARRAGLTTGEVVELHTGAELTVAFCGFSAGFAYLTGMPAQLHVPRLDTPRTAVPAGAVAVAGEFTAVYPRRSPGGWRLLGRTGTVLWDERRTPPALLTPGARVRFVAE